MRPLGFLCPRLQTCVPVSLLLTYVFPILLQSHQANATHDILITHEDHNHHRLSQVAEGLEYGDHEGTYEPDFIGADRSIIGRSPTDETALVNNVPGQLNIERGQTQFWSFSSQTLSGPKSQSTGLPSAFPDHTNYTIPASSDGSTLYISLNTCLQPSPQSPDTNGSLDQLELYVSTSSDNQQPNNDDNDHAVPVDGGFAWLNISSVKSDVYISVVAPKIQGFTGVYNYELTASIDGFYASYYDKPELYFVDSDTTSALLYTSNMTNSNSSTLVYKEWMSRNPPPFTLFVQNQNNPSLLGMQRSYCALKNLAQVSMSEVDTTITSLNNGQPQQQFHAKALNGASGYYAILAVDGNSSDSGSGVVGGGGIVWDTVNFTTKQDNNCVLVYNLPFCSSVAYAAPGNPSSSNTSISNPTSLGLAYDQYASRAWTNFSYSLAQVACNTTSSAQYSLARNCTDCANAYKEWLCAVVIPRCEDFSNPAPYLQPRAIGQDFINKTYGKIFENDTTLSSENKSRSVFNFSRNPMIDSDIVPGPYKEILPCEDLCYELVRSCPSFMGFVCPLAGHGLNYSYGKPTNLSSDPPTCNSAKTGISGTAVSKALGPLFFLIVFCSTLAVMAA